MRYPSSINWFHVAVQPRVGPGKITASMCPPSRTRHRAWQTRAALASRRLVRLYRTPRDQAVASLQSIKSLKSIKSTKSITKRTGPAVFLDSQRRGQIIFGKRLLFNDPHSELVNQSIFCEIWHGY